MFLFAAFLGAFEKPSDQSLPSNETDPLDILEANSLMVEVTDVECIGVKVLRINNEKSNSKKFAKQN